MNSLMMDMHLAYPFLFTYPLLITSCTLIGHFFLVWIRRPKTKHGLKTLPSPPPNCIGGHEGQFNLLSPFLDFEKLAKKYGPIFQIRVVNQNIVVINDPRLAKELFEKRGSKYSGRPFPVVGAEILSQKRRIIFTSSGPMHTAFRRQIHNILSISRTRENHRIQELESRQVLKELLTFATLIPAVKATATPDFTKVQSILRRYTLSVVMTLSFNHRIRSLDDPIVKTVFEIMDDISKVSQPGQYIVDAFPILKYLPYFMKPWEWETLPKVERQWAFLSDLLRRTERQMNDGKQNSGLIRTLLEQRQGMNKEEQAANFLDDKCIGYQSETLMEAGADTTSVTLMSFLRAMVLNPKIMYKAQEAIDASIQSTRLPTFDDLRSIPYINQIVKEVMRTRPVLPIGVPRTNIADDEVDGYYVRANSLIIGNVWAMQHDPEHYSEPSEFRPERFEQNKQKSTFESSIEADAMDRDHYIFGWGRRICPGMHLAEASVLLLAARILWAFDITLAKDADGNELRVTDDLENDYDNSIISNPKVFPVALKVRSEEKGRVIWESFRDAEKVWEAMNLDLFKDT